MPVIKQLEERNAANTIEICKWSDRMDLVAFSTSRGCVTLQRLSWTRAWNLDPPKDGIVVKDLAWRPDGKVLAIGYSNKQVLLVNIENKTVLYKLVIEEDITCIFWTKQKTENNLAPVVESIESEQSDNQSSRCLPEVPPLTNSQEPSNYPSSDLFHDQSELNLLMIGTETGLLYISIFGQFPCTSVDLGVNNRVISAHFTDDTSRLLVTVVENNCVKVMVVNTEIYRTHGQELLAIASKHGHLNGLVTYLFNAIGPLKETWETILMEMDVKLSKYASKVPQGTLTSDFLDLLMFGITSDEMCEFLLQDLTEKGLKKFGQIIEMCYTNIQKLLLKHVTKAVQNICYHLIELRGMARLQHKYEILGLCEERATTSLSSSGALLAKVGEMHQIIADFTLNYKAFFRWLHLTILHLTDEANTSTTNTPNTANETTKISQQDIAHVCDFVQNFDHIGLGCKEGRNEPVFAMEKLGQYLRDEQLSMPRKVTIETSVWSEFLRENNCINQHSSIINQYKTYSLIMQLNDLKSTIDNIFSSCNKATYQLSSTVLNCFNFDQQSFTSVNINGNNTLMAFLLSKSPSKDICILQVLFDNDQTQVKATRVQFHTNRVLDIKFYNPTTLSVLLRRDENGILCQFPVKVALDNLVKLDLTKQLNEQLEGALNCDPCNFEMKNIEGMSCRTLAVSGTRGVSLVLNENGRKVRLFEMEADEDEDDEAEMTKSDCSMQEDK